MTGALAVDHFIRYYDKSLDQRTCREIIQRFDADPRQISGKVSGNAGPELDRAAKQTNELILPDDTVWSDIKLALQQSMSAGAREVSAGCQVPRRVRPQVALCRAAAREEIRRRRTVLLAYRLQLGAEPFALPCRPMVLQRRRRRRCDRVRGPADRHRLPRRAPRLFPGIMDLSPPRCAAAQRPEICLHHLHPSALLTAVPFTHTSS